MTPKTSSSIFGSVSLLILSISFYFFCTSVVEIFAPELMLERHEKQEYLTNDHYFRFMNLISCRADFEWCIKPPEEELTAIRIASYEKEIVANKEGAIATFIKSCIALVIFAPLTYFFMFWPYQHLVRSR